MQESTRPYLYFENIINGITAIPKNIQGYLGNVILVRNEEQRIERERQKQLELLSPPEADTGGFKIPFYDWFTSNKYVASTSSTGNSEKSFESTPVESPSVETPPLEITPTNESPSVETPPVETPPVESTQVESTSIENTPISESKPLENTPMNDSPPIENTPTNESPPVENTPVNDSPPIESPPMITTPVVSPSLQNVEENTADKSHSESKLMEAAEPGSKSCKVRHW